MKAPKRGKKFKEIVDRGCGLKYYEYEGDYDCTHGYDWECDECPAALNIRGQNIRKIDADEDSLFGNSEWNTGKGYTPVGVLRDYPRRESLDDRKKYQV
jgi:hypothetical protein